MTVQHILHRGVIMVAGQGRLKQQRGVAML